MGPLYIKWKVILHDKKFPRLLGDFILLIGFLQKIAQAMKIFYPFLFDSKIMNRGFTRRGLYPFADLTGTFWFFVSHLMNGNSTPLSKTLTSYLPTTTLKLTLFTCIIFHVYSVTIFDIAIVCLKRRSNPQNWIFLMSTRYNEIIHPNFICSIQFVDETSSLHFLIFSVVFYAIRSFTASFFVL